MVLGVRWRGFGRWLEVGASRSVAGPMWDGGFYVPGSVDGLRICLAPVPLTEGTGMFEIGSEVDDLRICLAPVPLTEGTGMFEIGSEQVRPHRTRVLESPFATHLRFEVAKKSRGAAAQGVS
ncbi:hypothetical protein [Nonomuraea sp. NPDC049750]|uniref:hypothetical protein n=1 Tax=Nonomuraea sp. NPDC049750 TaxID=3154738 RepID=UPI0033E5E91E